jgi:hypothetical protein
MTDDIVTRLRLKTDPSQMLMCCPPRPAPDMLCYEAADEIERLRALLADNLDWGERHMHEKHAALDEIERLRAVLLEIANFEYTTAKSLCRCLPLARAALAREKSND